jgi:DNA topoisomerase-1
VGRIGIGRPRLRSLVKTAATTTVKIDPAVSAKSAGLRYVTDRGPGITRAKTAGGFTYRDVKGKPVKDAATLARIKSLVIPPAWTDVWISPHASGHLQATGRDARGRKQSRYHADFRAVRDESKYGRVIEFAKALPGIRATVRKHLKMPGLSRERVLATVVSLLEKTLIRVGNDTYARDHQHYGLTTIHNKHVKVKGQHLTFSYVGKSGVKHDVEIDSPELAKVVRACQDLPEQQLFEYVDEQGKRHDVKSDDVNRYLFEITGQHFTAKDFRTFAGTVLASRALREFEKFDSAAQAKKNVVAAIEAVAKKLGNTRAVCRKCYIHPAVLNSYMDGSLAGVLQKKAEDELRHVGKLSAEEASVVTLLRDQMKAAK